jgi:hypothetical protein
MVDRDGRSTRMKTMDGMTSGHWMRMTEGLVVLQASLEWGSGLVRLIVVVGTTVGTDGRYYYA